MDEFILTLPINRLLLPKWVLLNGVEASAVIIGFPHFQCGDVLAIDEFDFVIGDGEIGEGGYGFLYGIEGSLVGGLPLCGAEPLEGFHECVNLHGEVKDCLNVVLVPRVKVPECVVEDIKEIVGNAFKSAAEIFPRKCEFGYFKFHLLFSLLFLVLQRPPVRCESFADPFRFTIYLYGAYCTPTVSQMQAL